MRIYLDWGVINKMRCALEEDEIFWPLRNYLLETNDFHVIPCSGAHLSDLASSDSEEYRDEIDKDLEFLEQLTLGFAFTFDTTKNVESWSSYHLKPWYEDVVSSNKKFFKDGNYLNNFGVDMPFGGIISAMMNSLKKVPSGITSEQLDTIRDQDFSKLGSFFQRSAGGSLHDLLGETVNMMQSFNNDDGSYKGVRNEFREKYKLHGAYDDDNVIKDMEAKLKMLSEDLSFDKVLKGMMGNTDNTDHFKQFTTHYLMLDFFGYKTDGKFKNMIQDATHAFYAGFCDMYISDDARARAKTKAVYNHLKIRTEVMSPEEFVTKRMDTIIGKEQDLLSVLIGAIRKGLIEENENDVGTPVSIHELPLLFGYFNRMQVNFNSEKDYGLYMHRRKRNLSNLTLYREMNQIVDVLNAILGQDVQNTGLYTKDDRSEIEAGTWKGRTHLWGQSVVHLNHASHLGLTLQIDSIDSVRKFAAEKTDDNGKGSR